MLGAAWDANWEIYRNVQDASRGCITDALE